MTESIVKKTAADFSKFPFWVEGAPPRKKAIQAPPPEAFPGTFPDAFPGEARGPKTYEGSHTRAVKLRARMAQFSAIYQAAWMVRYTQHARPDIRQAKAEAFIRALATEMKDCRDPEALVFAIADAITAFPYGVPWEG